MLALNHTYTVGWRRNQHSGRNCKIDMKTLLTNQAVLPDIVNIDVYGNWFESVGNGQYSAPLRHTRRTMKLDASSYQFKECRGGEDCTPDKKRVCNRGFQEASYQNIKGMYTKFVSHQL